MTSKLIKSTNVAIEANKVEISTNKTTFNDPYNQPQKPRLGLVDIKEVKKGFSSKENVDKELGYLSSGIIAQSKYGKTYYLFQTILISVDEFIEKVKEGGYEATKLDDKTILVRW